MAKIKVISGGMRAGKSEDIYRRYKRAKMAGMKVQVFKPDLDRRFSEDEVVSRDNNKVKCIAVPAENAEYILSVLEEDVKLVIIDEAQFFKPRLTATVNEGTYIGGAAKNLQNISDKTCVVTEYYPIVDVVQELFDRGIDIVIEGLDMDSERKPFGAMPALMAIATECKKIHAICEVCHNSAMYSYAGFDKKEQVALGDTEYTALCPECYKKLKNGKRLKVTTLDDGEVVKVIE